MIRPFAASLLALCIAAPVLAQESPPPMSPEGAGPVRVGMTAKEALAIRPAPISGGGDDPAVCEEYGLDESRALSFMIEDGRVVRTSASEGGRTTEGVKVGDPVAKVRATYKGLVKEGAPYDLPPAHDLYWWKTPKSGLRFEIDGQGRVSRIHAGGEAIRYAEGCF
ncbi:hypothetical protein [Caulobacter mirabilis]|uniref:Uncharacterized protein n=1 Tax=Caulobacter mirabilis TaxID=69666 RepID=A0A2D2AYJ4_9CAUL|nr:hypothetical protein [Caulobacter mirabilis]ATQ43007.1 hypothetical protein CSW64_11605 [Caulobacter mirabilis]